MKNGDAELFLKMGFLNENWIRNKEKSHFCDPQKRSGKVRWLIFSSPKGEVFQPHSTGIQNLERREPMMNVPMHRFMYTKLTKDQIAQKLAAAVDGPECVSDLSDVLEGKSYRILTDDGPSLSYRFKKKNKLIFSENQGASIKSGYGLLTLDHMVFFSHMVPETLKGYNVFIDLNTNLVTVLEIWFYG